MLCRLLLTLIHHCPQKHAGGLPSLPAILCQHLDLHTISTPQSPTPAPYHHQLVRANPFVSSQKYFSASHKPHKSCTRQASWSQSQCPNVTCRQHLTVWLSQTLLCLTTIISPYTPQSSFDCFNLKCCCFCRFYNTGVASETLHPESAWKDPAEFTSTLTNLGQMFTENFHTFLNGDAYVGPEMVGRILQGGPKLPAA